MKDHNGPFGVDKSDLCYLNYLQSCFHLNEIILELLS